MRNIFALIFIVLAFPKVTYSQFNGFYYAYTENKVSKREVKIYVKELIQYTDSIKNLSEIKFSLKFHVCLYFNDISNCSKKWLKLQRRFVTEIRRNDEEHKIIIHPCSIIDDNVTTKLDHLSVGPVLISSSEN
jgi:hypothetical protein